MSSSSSHEPNKDVGSASFCSANAGEIFSVGDDDHYSPSISHLSCMFSDPTPLAPFPHPLDHQPILEFDALTLPLTNSTLFIAPTLSALPPSPHTLLSSLPMSSTSQFPHDPLLDSHPPLSEAPAVLTPPPPPPQPPVVNEAAAAGSAGTAKRKRGRPKKYFTGGPGQVSKVKATTTEAAESTPGAQTDEMAAASSKGKDKEGRRDLGINSSKKKASTTSGPFDKPIPTTLGLGSTRNVIQPFTILVSEAEDVSEKLISFAQHNNGAVFVLAASGVLASIQLLEHSSTTSVRKLMGRFDILTMSGTLLLTKDGVSKSGHLTISVCGVDGCVYGGRVHGRLIAASPIQIIGGSIAPAAGKRASEEGSDEILLEKQTRQEWEAAQKREVESLNQRLQTTMEDLNQTKQQLNETKHKLDVTADIIASTHRAVIKLLDNSDVKLTLQPPPSS